MASSPAQPSTPSTPSEPRRTFLNRSVTVPARLINTSPKPLNPPAEIGATEGVETLYVHPNANIIKFTSSSRPSSASSGTPNKNDTSQGTLPWASPTERTMAAGPLEIYRVPGSVSFLHSGALLHAILPRSNCWCVDGVSKFALRVLPDTYYRIELPGKTEEDLKAVEELKGTLRKVLFFERTPCPFARGFVPEDPPKEVEVMEEVVDEQTMEAEASGKKKSIGLAKKWKLQGGRSWRPEGWVQPEEGEGSEAASEQDEEGGDESDEGSRGDTAELEDAVKELSVTTPSRPKVSMGFRSVTAPSPSAMRGPAQPSNLRTRVDVDGTVEAIEKVEQSRVAQLEPPKMRSLQAIPTDMPPSPPDSSGGADYIENQTRAQIQDEDNHDVEVQEPAEGPKIVSQPESEEDQRPSPTPPEVAKEVEQTQEISAEVDDDHISEIPQQERSEQVGQPEELPIPIQPGETAQAPAGADSPPLDSPPTTDRPTTPPSQTITQPEDPYAAIQARILARRSIGTTTALPPFQRKSSTTSSSTASSTISRRSNKQKHHQAFTAALLQRTCSVFLGPPARLVAIMLKIAARYADAAFGVSSPFYVESPKGQGERVPGSFLLVGEDVVESESEEEEDGEWGEDDFGVPLRSPVRIAGISGRGGVRERRGWDVD